MKWYWWALIALVVVVAIVMGWKAYQKSKLAATATLPASGNGTTVAVGTNADGTKVVAIKKAA